MGTHIHDARARPHGNSVHVLRGLCARFHTSLHSHQRCVRLPLQTSHLHECLLFTHFLDDRHFDWEDRESQCCIDLCSLVAKDVERVSTYLWVVCTSFENCLFCSFVHLLIRPFVLPMNLVDVSSAPSSGLS